MWEFDLVKTQNVVTSVPELIIVGVIGTFSSLRFGPEFEGTEPAGQKSHHIIIPTC